MKPLPKHLRPRWRYLAVELETWPEAVLDRRTLQDEFWRAGRSLLGDTGSAEARLEVVHFSFDRGRGVCIVRVHRGAERRARAALACVQRVNGEPLGLRITGTSGTIRGAREKYLGRHREATGERTVVFEDDERSAVAYPDGVDLRLDDSFAGATNLDLT